jgi:uncharacterized membrane protein
LWSLGGWALFAWDERFAPYLLVGSALYLIGTILLTIVYHVPRNEALARVEPRSAESHWRRYLSGWTALNYLRAATALAAAAALTIALHVWRSTAGSIEIAMKVVEARCAAWAFG